MTQVADSPSTFEVVIPFWCEGQDLKGAPLKLRRRLHVKLLRTDDSSEWQIQNKEFRENKPLTFKRQALTWLGWSFAGPILLTLWLWPSMSGQGARAISQLFSLPIVGYVAYIIYSFK